MSQENSEIVLYTTTFCPYCVMAKQLLASKGVEWEEVDLWDEPHRRPEMVEKAEGRHTVPQIFVNGQGLGGFDDIAALEGQGKLDGALGLHAQSQN